jgi:hypothetical protein
MTNEASQFQSSSLAQFVQMVPAGGYIGCGDDLFALVTNIGSGVVTSSPADQPLNQTINTTTNMYEVLVKSVYNVEPLISLAAIPFLGNVPGLGQPITLIFTANRPFEHPGGLQATPIAQRSGGTVTPFARVSSDPAIAATPASVTWRSPGIFQQIQAAGQTVVNINVVNVQANYGPVLGAQTGGWVTTGLTVQPGQKVWLDTQAVGLWNNALMTVDANGIPIGNPNNLGNFYNIDYNLPNAMLIGYTGTPPNLGYSHPGMSISNDPRFIPSGDTLFNFPVNYPGPLSLACNDDQEADYGSQVVRIIITQ